MKITPFAWRQQQRARAARHNLPDLRNDEDLRRYRYILFARAAAKRELRIMANWRRLARAALHDSHTLPALLRKQAS